jgi:hypothetical protein
MFFTYNSNVNEPPTGSQIRMDNVSQPAVTKIWVTKVTNDGVDVTAWLFLMGIDGNELYLQDKDDYAKRQWFFLTGDAVDKGGYFELPVVWDRGHAPLPTQALVMVLQGQVARDAVT